MVNNEGLKTDANLPGLKVEPILDKSLNEGAAFKQLIRCSLKQEYRYWKGKQGNQAIIGTA
jgi:hypothetical protein